LSESKSSYRQIIKSTSIFGGVQVFNILVSIIKSKVLAILVGPSGIGINSLFTSTTGFIGWLTNFGLGISAVKDISVANETGDQEKLSTVIIVFRRLTWITGTLGTLIILVLSPWLSQITFGNKNYTIGFVWISVTLLFNQLSTGQLAILQGLRKLRFLANANILGSSLGLVISLPFYYLYGVDAIVPVIILSSILSLVLSWYFSSKIKILRQPVSSSKTFSVGKGMLIAGFLMSLSNLMALGSSSAIRLYIQNYGGGIVNVGLYSAGFMIINTYTGFIFNAMTSDFFPRLSAVSHSTELSKKVINEHAEIAILILAPVLLLFLIFIDWMIILIYSDQFVGIREMMYWIVIGIFFKASSWSVGILFIVKGASKTFLWSELFANIYMLLLSVVGFHLWGLTGLGIVFLVGYILYLIQVCWISKIKYDFQFESDFYKIFTFQLSLACITFLSVKYLPNSYGYPFEIILIVVSSWYSYMELDKRIGIMSFFKKKRL